MSRNRAGRLRPVEWATARYWPTRLKPAQRDWLSDAVNDLWDWFSAIGMVGPDDARGRRFRHMGAGSGMTFPRGAVFGESAIVIGSSTLFAPQVTLSAGLPGEALDPAAEPVVQIGSRCSVGRGTAIVGLRSIRIEDDVTIAPNVYITDHNHSYDDPDLPIGRQWPAEAPVRIGAGSWLGTGVVVLPGSDLGRNVTVAAGSVVRGQVPDHSVVAGSPARVVRSRQADAWSPPLPARTVRVPPGWTGE
ncbi:MAG TPA: acyltransferase [Acidimicrobiales bacterium]|nr:acyltransferase [Acidimicrobiales bacterium]